MRGSYWHSSHQITHIIECTYCTTLRPPFKQVFSFVPNERGQLFPRCTSSTVNSDIFTTRATSHLMNSLGASTCKDLACWGRGWECNLAHTSDIKVLSDSVSSLRNWRIEARWWACYVILVEVSDKHSSWNSSFLVTLLMSFSNLKYILYPGWSNHSLMPPMMRSNDRILSYHRIV